MTMVEDKLLRGERTHAVTQQNVWLARVLGLRNDSEGHHVRDDLIKSAWSEFAKTAGRFCGQAVTPVIASVNDKFSLRECLSQFRVAADVLAESMSDLNDSANMVATAPFHARNGKPVGTRELESLRLQPSHSRGMCVRSHCTARAGARSRRAKAVCGNTPWRTSSA